MGKHRNAKGKGKVVLVEGMRDTLMQMAQDDNSPPPKIGIEVLLIQTAAYLRNTICEQTETAMVFASGDADDINANTTKETGVLLGAIADLKGDNKALRADNASLREAIAGLLQATQANTEAIAGLEERIPPPPVPQRPATPPQRPSPPSPDCMEADEDPTAPGGTKRRGEQASGLHSPPTTPRKPKAVGITSPPPTLMRSRHAAVERSPPPRTVERMAHREDNRNGLDHRGAQASRWWGQESWERE